MLDSAARVGEREEAMRGSPMSECYRFWEAKGGLWVCQHNGRQRRLEEDLIRAGQDALETGGRMPALEGLGSLETS